MNPLRRLLVASDLSPSAAHAEARAAMLAKAHPGAAVDLVQVLPDSPIKRLLRVWQGEAEDMEQSVVQSLEEGLRARARLLAGRYGVTVTASLRIGHPPNEIATAAETTGCDLIVVGGYGADLIRGTFLGATAEKVIRLTHLPVLVVKKPPAGPYRDVLVPTDFSPSAQEALLLTRQLIADGQVTLLHVYESLFESTLRYAGVEDSVVQEYRHRALEEARRSLDGFVAGSGLECKSSIVHGHPAAIIRRHAQSTPPDLLVMGKHGQSEMEELLLGSVTKHMLFETDCDLLVVRGRSDA